MILRSSRYDYPLTSFFSFNPSPDFTGRADRHEQDKFIQTIIGNDFGAASILPLARRLYVLTEHMPDTTIDNLA